MHERKELFFEGGLAQTRIIADGSNGLIHFLFEEMQGDVFLGPEIIEDSAFGDAGLAGNCFSRRGIKAFGLKERKRRGDNSLPNRCFVLSAPPHRTLRCNSAARHPFRCCFLFGPHNVIGECAHQIYE